MENKKCSYPEVSTRNDQQDESLTRQERNQGGYS